MPEERACMHASSVSPGSGVTGSSQAVACMPHRAGLEGLALTFCLHNYRTASHWHFYFLRCPALRTRCGTKKHTPPRSSADLSTGLILSTAARPAADTMQHDAAASAAAAVAPLAAAPEQQQQLPLISLATHLAATSLAAWRRTLAACAVLLAVALYARAVVAAPRLRGWRRAAVALPALAALHAVPLLFDADCEPLARVSATFLAVRLTSGKLLALLLGRGVLALPLTALQFVAVLLAPFMPAQLDASRGRAAAQQQRPPLPPGAAKAGAAVATAAPLRQWQQVTPQQRFSLDASASSNGGHSSSTTAPAHDAATKPLQQQHAAAQQQRGLAAANLLLNAGVVAAFGAYSARSWAAFMAVTWRLGGLALMWRSMQLLMWSASRPAQSLLGMTLAPHFRNPFVASSLADFWGRRWNITQGLVLRAYVYEPIVQGCLLAPPSAPPAPAPPSHLPSHGGGGSAGVPAANGVGRQAATAGGGEAHADSSSAGGTPCDAGSGDSSGGADIDSSSACTTAAGSGLHQRRRRAGATPAPSADSCKPPAALPPAAAAGSSAAQAQAAAPRWRRQLAAGVTFVVSGLEHELFLLYCTRRLGWRWFAFFSLQGLLLAAESQLVAACQHARLALHPRVASLAVLLVLGVAADAWFWPPLMDVLAVLADAPMHACTAGGSAVGCDGAGRGW